MKDDIKDFLLEPERLLKIIPALAVVTLIWLGTVFMLQEPENLDVGTIQHESNGLLGYTTTKTMEETIETLLHQPGGYVSNDIAPPFIFLDNRPAWESGVIKQLGNIALSMREEFSRPNVQSPQDTDLADVVGLLNNDQTKWIWPDYQNKLQGAQKSLMKYRARLMNDNPRDGQFVSKAPALVYWLNLVNKELGSISQQLSASRGELNVNTSLAGESGGKVAWADSYMIEARTPWLLIDDVFYEARGQSWALLNFFKAIRVDFDSVLVDKNATAMVEQIITELEYALQPVYWPYVINGSRNGYWPAASFSIRLSSDITRATNGIKDLITLLDKG